jgi:hypothetical protein
MNRGSQRGGTGGTYVEAGEVIAVVDCEFNTPEAGQLFLNEAAVVEAVYGTTTGPCPEQRPPSSTWLRAQPSTCQQPPRA